MTIAVVDTPVTAGQYSAPSAVPPVSLRPLGQANQRLENKYGDEVERISRSMRSAEPLVRMESPRSVSTRNPIVCECLRLERSALINAMEAGCHTVQALSMHTGAGTTCGGCLPRLAELTAETLWQTVYCLEVIDRAPRVNRFVSRCRLVTSSVNSNRGNALLSGRPSAVLTCSDLTRSPRR